MSVDLFKPISNWKRAECCGEGASRRKTECRRNDVVLISVGAPQHFLSFQQQQQLQLGRVRCGMMLAALRSRSLHFSSSSGSLFHEQAWRLGGFVGSNQTFSSSAASTTQGKSLLDLAEVQKILTDVRADDIRVIPVNNHCEWADYMVVATGRSTWHVKNIAQALIHQVKQKQKGARRMTLPSVEGVEEGKWVVIDSGKVIVHALEEQARAYYNLEALWTSDAPAEEPPMQDLEKAFIKVRPINNSKKRPAQPAQRRG